MLYLIRGLPGSGKTTYAKQLGCLVLSADDFMVDGFGQYRFDPRRLGEAHALCQARAINRLAAGYDVAVANTFVRNWEMYAYRATAQALGTSCEIVDLFDGGCSNAHLVSRCVHGVPLETIERMRATYEHDTAHDLAWKEDL